ncbi:MAG: hypothetical protein K9M08_00630 [Pirellula sp.]|nr:hypothetical protein [Pirellula sp.]
MLHTKIDIIRDTIIRVPKLQNARTIFNAIAKGFAKGYSHLVRLAKIILESRLTRTKGWVYLTCIEAIT